MWVAKLTFAFEATVLVNKHKEFDMFLTAHSSQSEEVRFPAGPYGGCSPPLYIG